MSGDLVSSGSTYKYPTKQLVDLPDISVNDLCSTVKNGSHYVFSHAYEIKKDIDTTIYKHIVLCMDLSKYNMNTPIRKFTTDTKFAGSYQLEKLIIDNPEIENCLNNIFSKDIFTNTCNDKNLILIRDCVMKLGCRGIIGITGNVLLYSEKDVVSYQDYQIRYKTPVFNFFK